MATDSRRRPYSREKDPRLPQHADVRINGQPHRDPERAHHGHHERSSRIPRGIRPEGESGRRGIHPIQFARILFRSSSRVSTVVNLLWPFVPAAIACRFALPESKQNHLIIFVLSYIAMVPCANTIGFAGQELARKVPHVFGVLVETTFGSVVEIVLFMILLRQGEYHLIQHAILGSVLATMLLCLGACFFAGGLRREEQSFDEAVSEAGSGLLLTAGFGLAIPSIFMRALNDGTRDVVQLEDRALNISRVISILLIVGYIVFVWFQARTHHGLYESIFAHDEARDRDRSKDLDKPKLTMTEAIVALIISIALVVLVAWSLVLQIEHIVERGNVSDAFMGLILVPVVEKAAEHLTAVDEAWDNQMNFALAHVLGATLQTAMFTGPLVVIAGWGLHLDGMGLNFEIFDIAVLILAIITVGNFLRDQKSNYLEGFLCIIVYIAIAVAAFNYPNPAKHGAEEGGGGGGH